MYFGIQAKKDKLDAAGESKGSNETSQKSTSRC